MKRHSEIRIWTTPFYDRFASLYDAFMRLAFPLGEKGRQRVVAELGAGTMLDVACGTGTLLAMAREKGLACHGLDLSQGMLKEAKGKVPDAELKEVTTSFPTPTTVLITSWRQMAFLASGSTPRRRFQR